MFSFFTFIIICISLWLYTTKVNKNFYQDLQKYIIDFVNNIIKNINPLTDNLFNNNTPLMKTNLYLMTFYKNIDLYNIIYNSNDFSFVINKENSRNIQLDDLKYLIPSGLAITDETLKTKLSSTYINQYGFSKFFLDLSKKGVYLLDYWNIFLDLFKPLLIIKSNRLIDTDKISKLNTLHNTDLYNVNIISNINNNSDKIIEVLYQSILILSNITIYYKQIVDLNNLFLNDKDLTTYNNNLATINNSLESYFTQLNTYLNSKTDFEYTYVQSYIYKVVDIEIFRNQKTQDNTNYIILYKMFNDIDNFAIYNQQIETNILSKAININY